MKRFALVLLVTIFAIPLAQGEGPVDETRTTLRYELLRLINRDRQMYGLAPVQLDPQASTIADAYCAEQIRNGTTGHFTTDGLAPYMRYSIGGGNDGVSENAAAWSATYRFSERALYEMIRRSEDAMMGEEPPHDGHRKTILDPYATHVGIGLAWEKGEFRIAQEFVRRYVEWQKPLPRNATTHDTVRAAGKPLAGTAIEAISVHYEPLPQTMPASLANAIDSYRLPDKRHDYLPRLRAEVKVREDRTFRVIRSEYSDGSTGDFPVHRDGGFAFDIPFPEGPGMYTVVVWVKKAGAPAPIAASNISIRVEAGTTGYAGTR